MSGIYKLLYRFDFENAQWSARVGVGVLLIWLLIIACTISSIRSQGLSAGQQRLWIAIVVFLPIIGLLAYLPFSVKKDDMPHYFRFRSKDRPTRGANIEVKKKTRTDDAG